MMQQLYRLAFTPHVFDNSPLEHPRAALGFITLPLIMPFLIIAVLIWPTTAIIVTCGTLLLATIVSIFIIGRIVNREDIANAWNYLRGNELF